MTSLAEAQTSWFIPDWVVQVYCSLFPLQLFLWSTRYGRIWRFPKMGAPPNHPFLDGIFHHKPSIFGYPHGELETPICIPTYLSWILFGYSLRKTWLFDSPTKGAKKPSNKLAPSTYLSPKHHVHSHCASNLEALKTHRVLKVAPPLV